MVVRRSPQNICIQNPQASGCPDAPNGEGTGTAESTTPGEVAATAIVGPSEAVLLTTILSPAATNAAEIVVTTIGTNDNGAVWTSSYTISTTEAVVTASASDTPAVTTEPPEAVQAQSESSDGELGAGAVAGLAIGTFVAGAIIAFIAAWLLFKRRDKKIVQKTCPSGYPIYADSSPELVMVQKNTASGGPYIQIAQTHMRTPVPAPSRAPATGDPLASVLPPPASDIEVQNRVSALFAQIHRHIDTFYRDVHASITPSMDSDLASFGKDVDMIELLQHSFQPTIALKHALVAFVLDITSPKQEGVDPTLWPEELTQVLKAHNSGKVSLSSRGAVANKKLDSGHLATAQAFHRRLSVFLYTQQNSLAPTHSQSRLSNLSALSLTRRATSAIREAAEHFSLAFFPWANPTSGDQERESDLAGVITEALECRIWLLGQSADWAFEWEEPGRGVVVMKPAVVVRENGGPRRVVGVQSVAGI
ncbi:hypothetical protein OPT61_g3798 [Boeremia exigua]|uniref:Uncharacterized protein n=1 Tax=Boeremia exigua TaxID=749465 RepID=A0ACC2IGQ3_9PLEO|nr:hypothetical protein OPT61_g3798 [Boeremia exigua]